MTLQFEDLPLEMQELLKGNQPNERRKPTSIEVIRREAIKALAAIQNLSTGDRERALRLAANMNKVK